MKHTEGLQGPCMKRFEEAYAAWTEQRLTEEKAALLGRVRSFRRCIKRDQAALNFLTLTSSIRLCARHRSYAICMPSHVSGLEPKALESRIAISTETPLCSLTNSDKDWRVTPICSAALVTDKPSGSRHCRLMIPPGCGGFFITIALPSSMVVNIIYINYIAIIEPKNYSPIP